jgi:hypothetical protein
MATARGRLLLLLLWGRRVWLLLLLLLLWGKRVWLLLWGKCVWLLTKRCVALHFGEWKELIIPLLEEREPELRQLVPLYRTNL